MRKLSALLLSTLLAGPLAAQSTIWGNNAQGPAPATIEGFDKTTGVRTNLFAGAVGNGRGIVVVGNIVYYTMTGDANIHMMNATTGADLGYITTSVASMSTIAWDGSQFWTSDYSGSNQAYRINTSGVVTTTINLALAGGNSDGMEYFNGKLIANRGDANNIYDVYDLTGSVITPAFITDPAGSSTGIAYDGTNFFVSRIFGNAIDVFSGTTGAFLSSIDISGSGSHLIEDLSVDYSKRVDTASTPEPASILLMATGLFGLGGYVRRRRAA